jgi:hypothetical protein
MRDQVYVFCTISLNLTHYSVHQIREPTYFGVFRTCALSTLSTAFCSSKHFLISSAAGAQSQCILRYLFLAWNSKHIIEMEFAETYQKNEIKSAFGILNFQASRDERFFDGLLDLFNMKREVYDTDSAKRKTMLTALTRFGIKPDVVEDAATGGKWLEAYEGKLRFCFRLPVSKRRQSEQESLVTSGGKRATRNGSKAEEKTDPKKRK